MLILAVETSCDETSAAVLRAGNGEEKAGDGPRPEVLSNIVLSQDEIHAPYGGVVPELASRQHIKTVEAIVREALQRAGAGLGAIDIYAVTQGPGLIGSLLVGLTFAKSLAYYVRKPVVGVDHLEAHLESVFLENQGIPYPLLGLLVSGGHTSLYLMESPLRNRLLGKTRDDAAGEALDKVAK
ncbi:MAG: tRNA (adenosine(37)-N6)-threonylcarbamoyltransferase complex transferase subunit TsaD, partial [Candidatus Aminicenantes bacterium]|nr:tRNA (adenosine(37)-N6)-threonylcarbamoyltransferase complex transferase subunit TsaD [Candidatus Aminicenantes bacterium]